MKWSYLFLIISFLLLAGCKTTRDLDKTEVPLKERKSGFLVDKIAGKTADYNTLAAEVRLDGDFLGSSYKLKGNLRLIRDSLIWMNLTKFGFEVGRVLITPDSFYMVNRLNREYMQEPLEELENLAGLKADFTFIQELLIGKVRYEIPPMPKTGIRENLYHVAGNAPFTGVLLETFMDKAYDYEKVIYRDRVRQLEVNYLEKGRQQILLCDRQFSVREEEDADFDVKCYFNNIEKDRSFSVRFEIPGRYDRI